MIDSSGSKKERGESLAAGEPVTQFTTMGGPQRRFRFRQADTGQTMKMRSVSVAASNPPCLPMPFSPGDNIYLGHMRLHAIRGGKIEDLEARKFNIGVGVSLGSKWFTSEHIVEQVKWALQWTRDVVTIYIADRIHAINLQARNDLGPESATRRALQDGERISERVSSAILENFGEAERARIVIARWDDIDTSNYRARVNLLYDEFRNNSEFRDRIKEIVRNFVGKEGRRFSEKKIELLSTYILEELPELAGRVEIRGNLCDAYTTPYDSPITVLVEQIQSGRCFENLTQDLLAGQPPKVMLEVR